MLYPVSNPVSNNLIEHNDISRVKSANGSLSGDITFSFDKGESANILIKDLTMSLKLPTGVSIDDGHGGQIMVKVSLVINLAVKILSLVMQQRNLTQ